MPKIKKYIQQEVKKFFAFVLINITLLTTIPIFAYHLINHHSSNTEEERSDQASESERRASQQRKIATYHLALQKWLSESPIKADTYTASQIRDILGRTNCTLYDIQGNQN